MSKVDELLLDSVMENRPLKDLIAMVSNEINNPLIVIDSSYKIICSHKSEKITDKYWINNLKKGYCSFEFISELKNLTKNKDIPKDSSPYILNCPGSEITRYVSKIIYRNIHFGYVVILDNIVAFKENTPQDLEKLSKTIGSVYLSNFELPENEDSKSQFIYSILINDQITEERINKDIERYNLRINLPIALLLIKSRTSDNNLLKEEVRTFLPSSIINNISGYMVVCDKDEEINKLIKQDNWIEFLKRNDVICLIGEPTDKLVDLSSSYKLMLYFLKEFSYLLKDNKSYLFSHLRSLLALEIKGKSKSQLISLIPRPILSLDKYDKKHNTKYIHILESLLKNRFSKSETAKELFLHRNSLSYHISKIEKIAGLDLNDSSYDNILQLGLILLKLTNKF